MLNQKKKGTDMLDSTDFKEISALLNEIQKIGQKKIGLTKRQKALVEELPIALQKNEKDKIINNQKGKKREVLYPLTTKLEKKVRTLDLPPEITSKILTLIQAIENITEPNKISQEIKTLNDVIEKGVQQKNLAIFKASEKQEAMKKMPSAVPSPSQIVVPMVPPQASDKEYAPFVQVRYTKSKFRKAIQDYLNNKILPDLVMAKKNPIVPIESEQEYPTKKETQYPKAQIELEQKYDEIWKNILVKKVQKGQESKGFSVQESEEILSSFESMSNMKKKVTMQALQEENPEIFQQQKTEEKIAYEAHLKKNLERQKRHKKEKEQLAEAKKEKESKKAVEDYFRNNILSKLTSTPPLKSENLNLDTILSTIDTESIQKYEKKLVNCLVKKVQKVQKKANQPIQTFEEIYAFYEKMSKEDKMCALQTMLNWNPQVTRQQDSQTRIETVAPQTEVRKILKKGKKEGAQNSLKKEKGVLDRLSKTQKKVSVSGTQLQQ